MAASRALIVMAPLLRPSPRLMRPSLKAHMSATATALARTRPETDKSRILEKPTRFNPPSHPSRRVAPRRYPGPDLNKRQREEQETKRYPNMMPPKHTIAYKFLTNRFIHLWISLSVLTSLAVYAMSRSFIDNTVFADQLPTREEWFSHPFQSASQFLAVYKLHVNHESEKVAAKRKAKIDDADKRKEFMRKHGVEPGFLTGSWMEKFGTMDAEQARAATRDISTHEYAQGRGPELQPGTREHIEEKEQQPRRRKVWFGIWG